MYEKCCRNCIFLAFNPYGGPEKEGKWITMISEDREKVQTWPHYKEPMMKCYKGVWEGDTRTRLCKNVLDKLRDDCAYFKEFKYGDTLKGAENEVERADKRKNTCITMATLVVAILSLIVGLLKYL